jgi:hypothetical protein
VVGANFTGLSTFLDFISKFIFKIYWSKKLK